MKSKGKSKEKMSPPKKEAKIEGTKYIEQLILEDHKPLKRLIETMKDDEVVLSKRREAFEEFAPLLLAHAKAEEAALYEFLQDEEDFREQGFEGQVEHSLAEALVEKVESSEDEDLMGAEIKVLAELVEHHIEEEEEEDMLPRFKKSVDEEMRLDLGREYLELKEELDSEMGDKFKETSQDRSREMHT